MLTFCLCPSRCLLPDGRWYKEVVKGNDDSRQDAVMQQVFSAVNRWLKADPECQRRNLNIRTYKVTIPFAG